MLVLTALAGLSGGFLFGYARGFNTAERLMNGKVRAVREEEIDFETHEILSDEEQAKELRRAMKEMKEGTEGISHEELKGEIVA